MKLHGLIITLLLVGCQSTPTVCEKDPKAQICIQSQYQYNTYIALQEFETKKSKKAFALAQTKDNWEFFGYAEGYSSQREANERALTECQNRVLKRQKEATCELIR